MNFNRTSTTKFKKIQKEKEIMTGFLGGNFYQENSISKSATKHHHHHQISSSSQKKKH